MTVSTSGLFVIIMEQLFVLNISIFIGFGEVPVWTLMIRQPVQSKARTAAASMVFFIFILLFKRHSRENFLPSRQPLRKPFVSDKILR